MSKTITFNELRRLKDSLPDGSMHNYDFGKNCGVHIEPGPDGGIVVLDDATIYDMAVEILKEQDKEA